MAEDYSIGMEFAKLCGLVTIAIGVSTGANNIVKAIKENRPNIEYKLQERNVTGNNTPDKFYLIDNKRVYLEIDGMSVE